MSAKKAKPILIIACILIAAILLSVASYLLYVVCRYYRVEDRLALPIHEQAEAMAPVGQPLSLLTYNIGFGAYSKDYSFFMDGGSHARAFSRDAVLANTAGSLSAIQAAAPNFILLQEVDRNGDRSYHVDQASLLCDGLAGYDSIFAQNYDSPYFFYPFHQPIGANLSGMMTLSNYQIESAHRRSLPIENSLYKYLDLDRAYTVSVIPVKNGRSLFLYNVHLSAYTSDGKITAEQVKMLAEDMQAQYEAGNYVVAAGDFNQDLLGDSSLYFTRGGDGEFTWAKPFDTALLPDGFTCHSGTNAPSCRNADSPYRADGTDFVLSVDGIIMSPNVTLLACETVDNGFLYSDHNPVYAAFILN